MCLLRWMWTAQVCPGVALFAVLHCLLLLVLVKHAHAAQQRAQEALGGLQSTSVLALLRPNLCYSTWLDASQTFLNTRPATTPAPSRA